jgi:hypothetical protein
MNEQAFRAGWAAANIYAQKVQDGSTAESADEALDLALQAFLRKRFSAGGGNTAIGTIRAVVGKVISDIIRS